MKRYVKMSALLVGLVMLLSACSSSANAKAPKQTGFFHTYFVEPFAQVIHFTAHLFSGNYGIAIILITILIRLILMPLMLNTYKKQQVMKEKMDVLKPEMTKIQAKIKQAKTKEEQAKLQQEMMGLYQKHGVNPLNMGCLPLIIQMPILMGFYYAIRSSSEIAGSSFLWFNLGHRDIPMALIAGVIYFFQSKVSMIGMTPEQEKQMKIMALISPIMILFVSFNAPAALPLYWAVGGAFLIGQTYLSKKLYTSQKEKEKESKAPQK
ncbi:OxaA precursor [Heyndrickxia shackletonii]|uniref:Membrane protein insertase YidC n=1 Tax=Heyndrickxia shackletonii TaxID=157838 RepID=A0A0Q3WYR1_9BACI|nr:membrane protein insertase YidC [Heyndrickxia shackletonii]KQL53844.1 OxaA precursor [Heyndrickxia shackletonii]MBB2481912.1 membrane protein insertase YidC [Bacillus sp. APMAM]NEY97884.1 membrane protein insertase YidC [Heyndrickxia shackletonii]RTZ54757.1 membrane protein insertase YidC [Bacillus sp. SAJ1]